MAQIAAEVKKQILQTGLNEITIDITLVSGQAFYAVNYFAQSDYKPLHDGINKILVYIGSYKFLHIATQVLPGDNEFILKSVSVRYL